MNYVAHCLLAENKSSEFRFGSMAPDLVGMARCRLQRIRSHNDRGMLGATELEVQKGIDFHIKTDVAFGKQPLFKHLKRMFSSEVAVNYFPADCRLTPMFADIGTELLLDGFVVEKWPDSQAMYNETIASAGRLAMGIATINPGKFIASVNEHRGTLPNYADPEVAVDMLAKRVADRPRLCIPEDLMPNVVRAFSDHKENVWQYGESLFLATQAEVAPQCINASIN